MDKKYYNSLVANARQIYNIIMQSPNPRKFLQRELQGDLLSAISNRWLVFQNIKVAAINRNFSLVQIAYSRNEALLAAKADTDPDRKAFVGWAVDYLRSNSKIIRKIRRDDLFEAWTARRGQTYAKTFFTATRGTPLSMQELRMQAFPDGRSRWPAPAAAGWEDDLDPGGGGAESDYLGR